MGIAEKRYACYYLVDGDDCSFWFSQTGHTVRWVIFLAIILVVLLWVVGGYYHAKMRLRKGLPPLAYHRCLVARRAPPPPQTYQANPGSYGYYSQDAYNMNHMPPPPVYDGQRPPEYPAPPPDGGSKIDPSQWRAEPTRRPPDSSSAAQGLGDVEAPAGPPPGHSRP